MRDLSPRPDIDPPHALMLGFIAMFAIVFVCYLAISLFQFGFQEGLRHAAEKRTVTVHHFAKHKDGNSGGQTEGTGDSNCGKLRASPEAETQNKT